MSEPDSPAPPPIRILGKEVKLTPPQSQLERYEILQMNNTTSSARSCAFALALCWPHLRRWLGRRGIVYTGEPMQFGEQVFNWLMEQKPPADFASLMKAGQAAINAAMEDELPGLHLPKSQAEAEEFVGKSETLGEDST